MFTGIVEELGVFCRREHDRLSFEAPVVSSDLAVGDSVSVNGCCLTVVDTSGPRLTADAVEETFRRTTLGALRPGDRVNLERPVRLVDRLGGHLVQGHVDAVGTVTSPAPYLVVEAPRDLLRYVVEKGSIAVDGCSLTVVEARDDGFSAAVIPHTAGATTLGLRREGDKVNLEVDIIAKYAERLLSGRTGSADDGPAPRPEGPGAAPGGRA